MSNNKIIFLDLENALIDTWTSPSIINHHLKSRFLHFTDFRLFSFAVLNEEDKKQFNRNIAPAIKDFFGVTFNDIVLIDDITDEIAKDCHLHFFDAVDRIDFRNTLGKQDLFLRFCKRFTGEDIVLFDDMVDDLIINDLTRNNKITLIHV